MGDRTYLKNAVESLIDSDSGVTDASVEANLAVATRHVAVPISNFNVTTANVLLAALSQGTYSANTVVDCTSAGLIANALVIQSTTNYIKLNFWKRNAAGLAKTNFATLNTAVLAANINAYVISEAANVTTNANSVNIARNASVGVDIVKTAQGTGGNANPAGLVFVTLKAR